MGIRILISIHFMNIRTYKLFIITDMLYTALLLLLGYVINFFKELITYCLH